MAAVGLPFCLTATLLMDQDVLKPPLTLLKAVGWGVLSIFTVTLVRHWPHPPWQASPAPQKKPGRAQLSERALAAG